jgi:hypothetical protein
MLLPSQPAESGVRVRKIALAAAMAAATFGAGLYGAAAAPAKIIILRHGEKANATALCGVGVNRSLALVQQYIGKGANNSLFRHGETPAAFLAITLHTLELVSPAAASWNLPVIAWSVVPLPKSAADEEKELDARTRADAADVMGNPAYDGKIVVMVWEHKHIANKKLQDKHPTDGVTLRQLLNLGVMTGKDHVHETWEGSNYDYFWIVEYPPGSTTPSSFKHERQEFTGAYASVPSNHWGTPEKLPPNSGCKS